MTQKINFNVKFTRNPITSESDDWKDTAHQWRVTINRQEFGYFTGIAHRKGNTPTPPTLDDVLFCLVSDAEAGCMTFSEWCACFGYDEDSRKALNIYHECQETYHKLRKARVNIEAERERLQDY